jgi:hypothetical protein
MTFVGKILVIVIMAFAILFLGISTVVFTASENWKEATAAEKKKVDKLRTENNDFQTKIAAAKKEMEAAKSEHKAKIDQHSARIHSLEEEAKGLQNELTEARTKLEVAQQNAKTALDEAAQHRAETEQLRGQTSAVEKQANQFKLQHADLTDKIREMQRQIQSLDNNNKDLRDRVARFQAALRQAGLPDDVSRYKGIENPPAVEGEVARVDARNEQMEITIGSDDGLVIGHELFLYRLLPRPEYLGKVKVTAVDPDKAVAKVIGRTVQGKKIKEGDIVSSTIRPRS